MRDPNRIDQFVQELGEIWKTQCPDWRFGQLIFNVIAATGDPFYLEDDAMLGRIKEYFKIEEGG